MNRFTTARNARFATIAVLVCTISGLALNSTGLFSDHGGQDAQIRQVAGLIPSLCYVAAIWMVERAFRSIGRGQRIEVALGNLMQNLGLWLFLGGIAFVFVQPLLLKALTVSWGAWAWFDVPSITLGCLGLLLFVMARPLRDAATARAEIEGIL